MSKIMRLIITGGGTGGHIFPGLAIIKALEDICDLEIMWIGTGKPIEKMVMENKKWQYKILNVKPIMGMGISGTIRSFLTLPINILSSLKMIINFNPHIVVGVGGYVSGPVILAAKFLGKKTAIHEQNLIPGLSNKIASRFVDVIWTSFEETRGFFPNKKVIYTGNPIRDEILKLAKGEKKFFQKGDELSILVLGGSQGAKALNRITSNTFNILNKCGIKLNIVHQTGIDDKKDIEEFYISNNIKAKVYDFINDIGGAYIASDLIICRAGATTLSEITALGKPSILIPFPYSTGGHQEENAMKMHKSGAAVFYREKDISSEKLASVIEELINSPDKLREMSLQSLKMGKLDAAKKIAENILDISGLKNIKREDSLGLKGLKGQLI